MKAKVLTELVHLFRKLFVFRDDAYIEWRNGEPTAVREYLSDEVLASHLTGKRRIGTYFLKSSDCLTPKLAFDVDKKSRKLVNRIVKRLRDCDAIPYVERSKSKGFHIWIFFHKPISAVQARSFARYILRGLNASKVEIFPKQDRCKDLGFGLALPLFKADVSKNRTVFLDRDFHPVLGQFALLRAIARTPRRPIISVLKNNPSEDTGFDPSPSGLVSDNKLRKSASAELVKLAKDATFFHTPENEAFAEITVNNHQEIWRLRDKSFKVWLARLFHQRFKTAPSSQALTDALGVLEGEALYGNSVERTVFTRVGEYRGSIVLDLANESWGAVLVKPGKWEVIPKSPIPFRRTRAMKELPPPERRGSIEELRQFLNVGEDGFILLVGWLISALNPRGPYPPLILQGEAGSAKSTTSRVLRALIDPNAAPLRNDVRDIRDLMIAATNSWCTAFDNLSGLPKWLSDALCCLATGGGFATRQLYSDDDEKIFQATRPILLNGIDGTVTRGDLLDRSIVMYLPTIDESKRQLESEFWERFYLARPRILGALLDAVATALARFDKVELKNPPRMADSTKWVTAAEPALGWQAGAFCEIYKSNRKAANRLTLESSPIVPALERLFIQRDEWTGTASQLLSKLNGCKPKWTNDRYWPNYPKTLSTQLRNIAPNLRAEGFAVDFDIKTPGEDSKRLIRLSRRKSKSPRWMKRYLRRLRR